MFSLVTACMNREPHLRQTLPHWLQLPRVGEIVIVDWSNASPLAGLRELDSRVRVVRVEGEPKWILSYAYNVGVAHATQPLILKCDADCLPQANVLGCEPGAAHFFAGYWKSGAAVNKPSVNGQCIFSRAQFDAVNGYSEYIRTYGRDDEDFYDRLIAAKFERREIAPALLDFLPHTHEERVSNQFALEPGASVRNRVLRDTGYNEMRNCFIARALPWTAQSARAGFEIVAREERLTVLRRDKSRELLLPSKVEQDAHLFALRFVTARIAGLADASVAKLDERACMAVVEARLRAPARTAPAPAVCSAQAC